MSRYISARGLGALMLLGGMLVLWISTIAPYWNAVHGPAGARVYTGFGMKGTFLSPFVIFTGLALVIGGDKVRTLIDGEHRHGKAFWMGLVTISLIVGALNTWWFFAQMDALHMRSDYAGHRIKGDAPVFKSEKDASAHAEAERAKPSVKFQTPGISQAAWDAMPSEMRANLRKDFPDMVPANERKIGS